MTSKEQELLQKLLATFKDEARDHIHAISSGLAALEKSPSDPEQMAIIERMFREAHSLKGAARAVNIEKIESVCQSLESLFASLKSRESVVSKNLLDRLYRSIDSLSSLLSSQLGSPPQDQKHDAETVAVSPFDSTADVNAASPPTPSGPTQETTVTRNLVDERPQLSETLRVSIAKLDSLFRQTEELLPLKVSIAQRILDLREIEELVAQSEREWSSARPLAHSLRRSSRNGDSSLDKGEKLQTFLDNNVRSLAHVRGKLALLVSNLSNDRRSLDRKFDDLVQDVRRVSMVPFSVLLEAFPKLVRDLCRDCGKDAELVVTGADLEVERRVIEELKDPLIHLLRNAIDHGIEIPEKRRERGKGARAKITINVAPKNGDKVEISVSDDGAGIESEKVLAAAARFGSTYSSKLSMGGKQQALDAIFESGVSTSPMITEVSGRGLGLAIVREKVEKIGGSVAVETQPGVGTIFRLIVPLLLARFRGVTVRVCESQFVLPTAYIHRVLRIDREDVRTAENRETIRFEESVISAVRLGDVLGVVSNGTWDSRSKQPALILGIAGERIAFFVDEVLEEREILVSSLGQQLLNVQNVAGATIVGSGKVLPVLNVTDLMRSAVNMEAPMAPELESEVKSVLVAEDSITTRTMLKHILQSAGYKVTTAVDGAEALHLLEREGFDLLVSDVDMPRMNGLELISKIRSNKQISRLPVVLVTALNSIDDRERGLNAGADAYITKGGFEHNSLLDVVGKLL
jgi:two-component system chemotaxis sensor kinase CheA